MKRKKLKVTVISVGNITLGGAGKTPVVVFLAGFLKQKGCRVGVLSRGYKRKSKGVQIVSNGNSIRSHWIEAGDEPYLFARKLPGIPVCVGKNRVSAGQHTLNTFHPDILLLDDGFQHVTLHRDIDIVAIDASNPFGNGRVLPAGPLREPLQHLKRANLFWLTRVDQADDLSALQKMLQAIQPEGGIVQSTYRPIGLKCCKNREEADLSLLKGAKTILLCGIANPTSFEKTVEGLGADIIEVMAFPDHHPFTIVEMREVQNAAVSNKANLIITTEKDGVRIPDGFEHTIPIYELIIEVCITQGEELLERVLWN